MIYIKHSSVKIDWLLDQAILLLMEKNRNQMCHKVEVEKNNSTDKILKNFTEVYKIY